MNICTSSATAKMIFPALFGTTAPRAAERPYRECTGWPLWSQGAERKP